MSARREHSGRVPVIGAWGLIGSHVLRQLQAAEYTSHRRCDAVAMARRLRASGRSAAMPAIATCSSGRCGAVLPLSVMPRSTRIARVGRRRIVATKVSGTRNVLGAADPASSGCHNRPRRHLRTGPATAGRGARSGSELGAEDAGYLTIGSRFGRRGDQPDIDPPALLDGLPTVRDPCVERVHRRAEEEAP